MLDEYFASTEFLSCVEAGNEMQSGLANSATNASMATIQMSNHNSVIPTSHQLISASPFVDSGIGLNVMASSKYANSSIDADDEVFIIEDDDGNL